MAGHSKWKNIQHRKGAQDAKRGKVFTKIAKEITVAAKAGGADPESNARLRMILAKAKAANMPKDNIDRAIKKGIGDQDGADFIEKTYEGYAAGGIAILIDCLTDNVNRTVSEVRHALTRAGGSLGTEGSVAYQFETKGIIVIDKSQVEDTDSLFELAIEHGAEDVSIDDESVEMSCDPSQFSELQNAIEQNQYEPALSELNKIPQTPVEIDESQSESLQKLLDRLEELDDVQAVYHNASIID